MQAKHHLNFEHAHRIVSRFSLFLAAALPLTAIGVTHYLSSERLKPKTSQASPIAAAGKDVRLINFCTENVKDNRAFVLFNHGTCIVIEDLNEIDQIRDKAFEILKETAIPNAKFVCSPVEDNNLIVSYTKPVFHLRFQEDIDKHRASISNDFVRFLTPEERASTPLGWNPPFHAKIGLRSRARLIKDAHDPVIAQIIAPTGTKQNQTGQTASISL